MSDDPYTIEFAENLSRDELEEGDRLAPAFDDNGLIPAIAQHAETREILMFAWMNSDALRRSIETGEAWYFSRSRNELWHKGDTSGQIQDIREIRTDCDQDVLLLLVVPRREGACHVGYRSCFYRSVQRGDDGRVSLTFEETEKVKT